MTSFTRQSSAMKPCFLCGFLLALPLGLACIWHGQLRVNPSAQLLLWPQGAIERAER